MGLAPTPGVIATPGSNEILEQKVKRLEDQVAKNSRHIEDQDIDLEALEQRVSEGVQKFSEAERKLAKAERELKRLKLDGGAPLAAYSQGPSANELQLQHDVERLQQELLDLRAQHKAIEDQAGPSQQTPATSNMISDLQQQLESQEVSFRLENKDLKEYNQELESKSAGQANEILELKSEVRDYLLNVEEYGSSNKILYREVERLDDKLSTVTVERKQFLSDNRLLLSKVELFKDLIERLHAGLQDSELDELMRKPEYKTDADSDEGKTEDNDNHSVRDDEGNVHEPQLQIGESQFAIDAETLQSPPQSTSQTPVSSISAKGPSVKNADKELVEGSSPLSSNEEDTKTTSQTAPLGDVPVGPAPAENSSVENVSSEMTEAPSTLPSEKEEMKPTQTGSEQPLTASTEPESTAAAIAVKTREESEEATLPKKTEIETRPTEPPTEDAGSSAATPSANVEPSQLMPAESKGDDKTSLQPSSITKTGDEPVTDASIMTSSTDRATAALPAEALHSAPKSKDDKSFLDALKSKRKSEMTFEEYGAYAKALHAADDDNFWDSESSDSSGGESRSKNVVKNAPKTKPPPGKAPQPKPPPGKSASGKAPQAKASPVNAAQVKASPDKIAQVKASPDKIAQVKGQPAKAPQTSTAPPQPDTAKASQSAPSANTSSSKKRLVDQKSVSVDQRLAQQQQTVKTAPTLTQDPQVNAWQTAIPEDDKKRRDDALKAAAEKASRGEVEPPPKMPVMNEVRKEIKVEDGNR